MQKEERRIQAEKHTKEMEIRFPEEIMNSIRCSRFYGPSEKVPNANIRKKECTAPVVMPFEVKDQDVVTAIFENESIHRDIKTAVLNFASYKEPGGRFIDGSMAQEEALCHNSALYNILKRFEIYYRWNCENLNRALYLNRGIYSPNVPFVFGERSSRCDVITVASPNKHAAQKYCNISDEENSRVLRDRIRFVLDIAEANKVDTLILGAYGCGGAMCC